MPSLSILHLNTMLCVPEPVRFTGQEDRKDRIPPAIALIDRDTPIDVIICSELVTHSLSAAFAELGWQYSTKSISEPFTMNGGIVVFSKYPIIEQKCLPFDACAGSDCLISKGVVFARIRKDADVISVFGTHLQAWTTPEGARIRERQVIIIREFMNGLSLPEDELTVLAGDLNVDLHTCPVEAKRLASIMGMTIVPLASDSLKYTSDPRTNQLVGNDLPSAYATVEYPNGCYEEYLQTLSCVCCPQEYLDYILCSKTRPAHGTVRVVPIEVEPFSVHLNITTERVVRNVSDHHAVVGQLTWDSPGSSTVRVRRDSKSTTSHCIWLWILVSVVGLCVVYYINT